MKATRVHTALQAVIGAGAALVLTGASGCSPAEATTESTDEVVPASKKATAPSPPDTKLPASGRAAPEEPAAAIESQQDGLCDEMCGHTAPLKCGDPDRCVSTCEEMLGLPVCAAEMERVLRCGTGQALERWTCSEEGPILREGACDGEQERFAGCLGEQLGVQ